MAAELLMGLGGTLIGLSAILLMGLLGRVAGISGIAAGLLARDRDWMWRAAFVLGLVIAAPILGALRGNDVIGAPQVGPAGMALAGVLVGLGTHLGSGCTSGHGVCGIARLSLRSLAATVTFVACGIVTVLLVRHVLGVR